MCNRLVSLDYINRTNQISGDQIFWALTCATAAAHLIYNQLLSHKQLQLTNWTVRVNII
jgi:hypothetical protein